MHTSGQLQVYPEYSVLYWIVEWINEFEWNSMELPHLTTCVVALYGAIYAPHLPFHTTLVTTNDNQSSNQRYQHNQNRTIPLVQDAVNNHPSQLSHTCTYSLHSQQCVGIAKCRSHAFPPETFTIQFRPKRLAQNESSRGANNVLILKNTRIVRTVG